MSVGSKVWRYALVASGLLALSACSNTPVPVTEVEVDPIAQARQFAQASAALEQRYACAFDAMSKEATFFGQFQKARSRLIQLYLKQDHSFQKEVFMTTWYFVNYRKRPPVNRPATPGEQEAGLMLLAEPDVLEERVLCISRYSPSATEKYPDSYGNMIINRFSSWVGTGSAPIYQIKTIRLQNSGYGANVHSYFVQPDDSPAGMALMPLGYDTEFWPNKVGISVRIDSTNPVK